MHGLLLRLGWRWLLVVLGTLALPGAAQAQASISGEVRDSLTQAPLAFASVFLANTTRGATTDAQGRFTLPNVPAGSYDVVCSYLGYRLARRGVQVGAAPVTVQLRPAPLSQQLAGVVVRPHRNRPEDYQRFVELFVGTTAFSGQCRIRNPDGVRVDFDPGSGELTAEAYDYLQVDNAALGYRIRFYGLHFQINFREQVQSYYAWPVFEELPTKSAARRARWAANRLTAYRGSLPHFLRSVRTGQLTEEGFVANRLRRVPNPRWVRADSLLSLERQRHAGEVWHPADSLLQRLREPPQYAYLYTRPLPADSLRRPSADGHALLLRFRDLVQVTYLREPPDPAYALPHRVGEPAARPEQQVSVLHLLLPAIAITPTGQLLDPLAVFTEGYWGFERIGELLPVDYEPPADGGVGRAGKKE
ncbi:carboxypeptidase-like regulatory domain-containing protein [Hymenobacter sp. 15J16-1T3B]|uniref:carboxypeptidase-like regulatory domain-containing protein n=1 Tax=Hymenobacter sp. 15J16-1T3B TaxID=2886941 RepID=UPI001D0FCD93|nr:carboxypeptidase-like regulatory domain-containing protein [Hymenobacter sp. 15J16-1T3B]MCC3157391.1 carboxypeptidase-like regulatory domain-containing protein [Hymenobacter sp. 15J16-1T3B]